MSNPQFYKLLFVLVSVGLMVGWVWLVRKTVRKIHSEPVPTDELYRSVRLEVHSKSREFLLAFLFLIGFLIDRVHVEGRWAGAIIYWVLCAFLIVERLMMRKMLAKHLK